MYISFKKTTVSKSIWTFQRQHINRNHELDDPLTERRLHGNGRGLLWLLAEAEEVDGLDAEHIGLAWDQAVHHKPEARTHSLLKSNTYKTSWSLSSCFYIFLFCKYYFLGSICLYWTVTVKDGQESGERVREGKTHGKGPQLGLKARSLLLVTACGRLLTYWAKPLPTSDISMYILLFWLNYFPTIVSLSSDLRKSANIGNTAE